MKLLKRRVFVELFSLFIVLIDIYTSMPATLTTCRMKTFVSVRRFRRVPSEGVVEDKNVTFFPLISRVRKEK